MPWDIFPGHFFFVVLLDFLFKVYYNYSKIDGLISVGAVDSLIGK